MLSTLRDTVDAYPHVSLYCQGNM